MRCWYCGKEGMQRVEEWSGEWYCCPSCGATHIENPITGRGGDLISTEHNPAAGKTKYRPSASVQSKAKRAREAKKKALKGKK